MAKEGSTLVSTFCDHCKGQIKPPSLRENTSGEFYVREGECNVVITIIVVPVDVDGVAVIDLMCLRFCIGIY